MKINKEIKSDLKIEMQLWNKDKKYNYSDFISDRENYFSFNIRDKSIRKATTVHFIWGETVRICHCFLFGSLIMPG